MQNSFERMTGQPQLGLTILERLDLSVAMRFASRADDRELLALAQRYQDRLYRPVGSDAHWVAALLRLRGFMVLDEDVAAILSGHPGRLPSVSQEHALVIGLARALETMRARAARGMLPDGWFLVALFQSITRNVARFHSNALRVDAPWDAILYLGYPDHDELNQLIDVFDWKHRYGDNARTFDSLHPVRQSFRILWRLARIAPFPDLNLVLAWLAMCSYLLAKGYPLVAPEPQDQGLLHCLVAGPPPKKILQFESRLLDASGCV
jgi:hypothetical protein